MSALRRDGEITAYGSSLPEIPVPFFPAILKNARLQFFIVYNLSDADRKSGLAGVTGPGQVISLGGKGQVPSLAAVTQALRTLQPL